MKEIEDMDKVFDDMTNEQLVIFFSEKKEEINLLLVELMPMIEDYEEKKKIFFDLLKEIEKRNIKIEI